jgi:hypothetical protein
MRGVHDAIPVAGLPLIAAAQHIERREEHWRNIMTLFRNLFPRRQSRREAELAYLNGAVSLYDLEQREREIDRGMFARF